MKQAKFAFLFAFVMPFILNPIIPAPTLTNPDALAGLIGGLILGVFAGLCTYYGALRDKVNGRGAWNLALVAGFVLGQASFNLTVLDAPVEYALVKCVVAMALSLFAYHHGVKKYRQKH